jgi:hypothetical protein
MIGVAIEIEPQSAFVRFVVEPPRHLISASASGTAQRRGSGSVRQRSASKPEFVSSSRTSLLRFYSRIRSTSSWVRRSLVRS